MMFIYFVFVYVIGTQYGGVYVCLCVFLCKKLEFVWLYSVQNI